MVGFVGNASGLLAHSIMAVGLFQLAVKQVLGEVGKESFGRELGEVARLCIYSFCLKVEMVQVVAALCAGFTPLCSDLAVTSAYFSPVEHCMC